MLLITALFRLQCSFIHDGAQILPLCMECRRGLAMRILSVRLFVRPSVKRVICDEIKESCACILIPHERSFTLIL